MKYIIEIIFNVLFRGREKSCAFYCGDVRMTILTSQVAWSSLIYTVRNFVVLHIDCAFLLTLPSEILF